MIGTVAVAALAIAGTGCGKKNDAPAAANAPAAAKAPAADPNEVLVTVNGAKLTRGEIDAVVDKQLAAQNVPAAQMDQARKYFSQQFAQAFIMKTSVSWTMSSSNSAPRWTVGSFFASMSISDVIDVVVVFPCVPEIFMTLS